MQKQNNNSKLPKEYFSEIIVCKHCGSQNEMINQVPVEGQDSELVIMD